MSHRSKTFQAIPIYFTKVKKPPYVFFTHLFFALAIILLFGGFFLHMISRIIKVKPNCLNVQQLTLQDKNTEPGRRIQIQVRSVGRQ